MERYTQVVSFANQANLALANHNYQDALEAYASALKIGRELERSRLVAVLFNRMGSVLQVKGEIQDAAIAYESALRALETGIDFNVESVINRLSSATKGFYSAPQPIPDLYSAKVAETLESDENEPALAVKLWLSVSARATMKLMVAFYKNYFQLGNKAIALQKAKQTVRSQAEYNHSRYWASFIVVGAKE